MDCVAIVTDPEALFAVDGDLYVPSVAAQGPWGRTVSGHVVGGILGHVIDRDAADPDLQPARLTVDLFRPTLMKPVQVQTAVQREGKRIRLVDAAVIQDDVVVARASALYLRRSERPAGDVWTAPLTMPPIPSEHTADIAEMPMLVWSYNADTEVAGPPGLQMEQWQQDSDQKFAWVRQTRPLVQGEALTAFTRAAMAGDVTSALCHWGTGGLRYINADYTLTLSRLPEGEYIGLAALSHLSDAGVAAGTAAFFDERGPIGTGIATALVDPADSFLLPTRRYR